MRRPPQSTLTENDPSGCSDPVYPKVRAMRRSPQGRAMPPLPATRIIRRATTVSAPTRRYTSEGAQAHTLQWASTHPRLHTCIVHAYTRTNIEIAGLLY